MSDRQKPRGGRGGGFGRGRGGGFGGGRGGGFGGGRGGGFGGRGRGENGKHPSINMFFDSDI